jgi:hypothetical protein
MQITYARASAEDIDNIYTFCVQLMDAYEDKAAVDYDKSCVGCAVKSKAV